MMHVLSFDFEEWFHIIQNHSTEARPEDWDRHVPRIEVMTEKLLAFLRERNVKATFFVLGWVAAKYPSLIARLAKEGHEIGCHSHLHRPVWSLSREEFSRDLRASLDAIESASGTRPRIFRAPGFSIDSRAFWAFDVLAENGILLDSSIYPGQHNHGGLPGAPASPFRFRTDSGALIREFPISIFSFFGKRVTFSGGGFFRLLPLFLQRKGYRAYESAGNPVVTYFHPRDFDSEIPASGLGWIREFKNNVNTSGAFAKLSKLLDEYEMTTLTTVDKRIDWERRPVLGTAELLPIAA